MAERPPMSRGDAPAYLAKYQQRIATPDAAPDYENLNVPPYLLRARERSVERAEFDALTGDGPPNRSEAFGLETVAPRELDMPDPYRRRVQGSTDVRLIRHGQTQGYVSDAALTDTGRWQAHHKGQDFAKGLQEGMTVRLLHAPTPRAYETAVGVHEGLLQGAARYGIKVGAGGVEITDPTVAEEFDNFQVFVNEPGNPREMDVTAAFRHMATLRNTHDATGAGEREGWYTEVDRFYKIQAAGGDPITQWLNIPLLYIEPPVHVIRRFWAGIQKYVAEGPANQRILICTHSGPIRAMAASAVGHDPGEPNNVEDVRIRVFKALDRALMTYRGRGVEVEIPTTVTPSWWA